MAKEIKRYSSNENEVADMGQREPCYRPAPLSESQLRKAAEEFVRRCQDNAKEEIQKLFHVLQECIEKIRENGIVLEREKDIAENGVTPEAVAVLRDLVAAQATAPGVW